MAMSKRHFIRLADIMGDISNPTERDIIARKVADFCRGENSNFDYGRFMGAVGEKAAKVAALRKERREREVDPSIAALEEVFRKGREGG